MVRGTTQLKGHVFNALAEEDKAWVEAHIGFVDSAVDRIVPPSASATHDPLEVTVETFSEWIVDKTQFKGALPTIPGMELTDNLMAFVERKLFTLNTGHAITAYLGKLAGHQTIRDAILDQKIRAVVQGAMEESGAVLIKRYAFDPQKHAAYIQKILGRFENPYLKDDVERVGRQPLRKLSAGDRLIKPLLGTLEYGLPHRNPVKGIAAAMHFRSEDDPQAQELAALIADKGPQAALAQISGPMPQVMSSRRPLTTTTRKNDAQLARPTSRPLRLLSDMQAMMEETQAFENRVLERLNAGKTVRSFLIATVELLTEAVNILVLQVFRKDDYAVKYAVEPLLEGSGPLGDLSVRLKLIYGLGVISRAEYEDAELLMALREELNHDGNEYSFTDDEIIGPFGELHCVAALPPTPQFDDSDAELLAMQKLRYQQMVRSTMVLSLTELISRISLKKPFRNQRSDSGSVWSQVGR